MPRRRSLRATSVLGSVPSRLELRISSPSGTQHLETGRIVADTDRRARRTARARHRRRADSPSPSAAPRPASAARARRRPRARAHHPLPARSRSLRGQLRSARRARLVAWRRTSRGQRTTRLPRFPAVPRGDPRRRSKRWAMLAAMRGVAGIAVVACALAAASVARADGPSDEELAKQERRQLLHRAAAHQLHDRYRPRLSARASTTTTTAIATIRGSRPRRTSTACSCRASRRPAALQFHWLDFDAPKIFDSPYRIRSQLIYERNINQNYFGIGNARSSRCIPGLAGDVRVTSPTTPPPQQQVAGGTTFGKYDEYDLAAADLHRERRAAVPATIACACSVASGSRTRGFATTPASRSTRPTPTGSGDDRDRGADPARDRLRCRHTRRLQRRLRQLPAARHLVRHARLRARSESRRVRRRGGRRRHRSRSARSTTTCASMIAARGYWSPLPTRADLVLAGRARVRGARPRHAVLQHGHVPVHRGSAHRSRRSPHAARVSPGSVRRPGDGARTTTRSRWTFAHARFWRQRFAFILVPFLDIGRPYDRDVRADVPRLAPGVRRRAADRVEPRDDHHGRLRVQSNEDTGFYVNFNHMF